MKFRTWDREYKKMKYSCNPVCHGDLNVLDFSWLEKEYVVMQYTGLKDKNDKEIWEGDIVTFLTEPPGVRGKSKKCYGEVWYRPEECGYSVKSPQFMYSDGKPMIIGLCSRPEYYEVVGNIYENSALLEATKCGGEKA